MESLDDDRRKALDIAGEARDKALSAVKQLERAFEEIDDYGVRGAAQSVSSAEKQLRQAAELLEWWES